MCCSSQSDGARSHFNRNGEAPKSVPCPLLFPSTSLCALGLERRAIPCTPKLLECICYTEIQHRFKIRENWTFPIKRHFFPQREIKFTALQLLLTSAVRRACVSYQPHVPTCLFPCLAHPTSQLPRLQQSLTSAPHVLVAPSPQQVFGSVTV